MPDRLYTSKQMGDACEMLVAAEMTLAGVPAMKVPDNWPSYDVIAQPRGGVPPQRISVKSRTFKRGGATFVVYDSKDPFDWLAIVLLPGADQASAGHSSSRVARPMHRRARTKRRPAPQMRGTGVKMRSR